MATISRHYGKWQVQKRRKNQQSKTKSFVLKKDAEVWARKAEIEIQQGSLGLINRTYPLFIEVIEKYLNEVSINKKGHETEKYHLANFKREYFVNLTLDKITPQIICKYRDKRLKEVKASTLLREFNILQHLFNIANKEWGHDINNPFKKITKPSAKNRRERRLTETEYNFLVRGNYPQSTLRNIIEFAIETAMRRGEILNIQQEHIKGQTLLIPESKNGHSRIIPLTKKALYILENTQLPFPMTANAVRLAWDRLKKKGNIKGLHFHTLRHEAISRFFEKGLSVPEVALISGHNDPRMLFRYTHLKAEDVLLKLTEHG